MAVVATVAGEVVPDAVAGEVVGDAGAGGAGAGLAPLGVCMLKKANKQRDKVIIFFMR